MIMVKGNRVISEVNIMVHVKNENDEVDTTSYARFYDFVEKRVGRWKILKCTATYETDRADPVQKPLLAEDFFKGLNQYPSQLQFLASGIKKVGAEITKSVVLDKSQDLRNLYEEGKTWLSSG